MVLRNQITKSKRLLTKYIDDYELKMINWYSKHFTFEESFQMATEQQWIFNKELSSNKQILLDSKGYVGLKQINDELNEICKISIYFR